MADDEHPLFTEHKKWAVYIGRLIAHQRGYAGPLSYSEITNASLIGLMYAVRDYRAGGVPFQRFALKRIKGAVMDEFRSRHRGFKTRRNIDTKYVTAGDLTELFADGLEASDNDRREADEVTEKLIDLVNGSKRKLVMRLYYIRGLTLLEIGVMIGLTESRICQLHAEGCRQLATRLKGRAADFIKLGGRK